MILAIELPKILEHLIVTPYIAIELISHIVETARESKIIATMNRIKTRDIEIIRFEFDGFFDAKQFAKTSKHKIKERSSSKNEVPR